MQAIKGIVKKILDKTEGESSSGYKWNKQKFVISNNEGYEGKEQIFCFEVFGNDERFNNIIQNVKEGSEVEVWYNIQTNEYKENYYTSLQAWKVQASGVPTEIKTEEGEDHLPF